MKFKMQKSRVLLYTLHFTLCVLLFGCEAFVRKFTRPPKKENLSQKEFVLSPEDYENRQPDKEEQYRQYFLFWKSWQDELIEALFEKKSRKKQIDCIQEAQKNLLNFKQLLKEEKQQKLESCAQELDKLEDAIKKDLYGDNANSNCQAAEQIKRNVLRDFSCRKIKEYLK